MINNRSGPEPSWRNPIFTLSATPFAPDGPTIGAMLPWRTGTTETRKIAPIDEYGPGGAEPMISTGVGSVVDVVDEAGAPLDAQADRHTLATTHANQTMRERPILAERRIKIRSAISA